MEKPMLTIFAIPKPFEGHIGVIQRNAITSWTLLEPRPEIILFGDERGTEEMCLELGLLHHPHVEKNEFGTPFLNDVFCKAERHASHVTLCYANSDIIFMSDFMQALQCVRARKSVFLLVGRRWDLDIFHAITFGESWEGDLARAALADGHRQSDWAIDYFVFPKGKLNVLPPFLVGRAGWDNWFIYNARRLRWPVIDVTPSVVVVHQNHNHSHIKGFDETTKNAPEHERNRELAGPDSLFTLVDATHRLEHRILKRNSFAKSFPRNISYVWPALHPMLRGPLLWTTARLKRIRKWSKNGAATS
jgi:hypothetical protein